MQGMNPAPEAARPIARAKPLGELLVEAGVVSAGDVQKGLSFQEQFGGRIGSILVRLGALSEETLLPILSRQLEVPVLAGDEWPEQPGATRELLAESGFAI